MKFQASELELRHPDIGKLKPSDPSPLPRPAGEKLRSGKMIAVSINIGAHTNPAAQQRRPTIRYDNMVVI